MGEARADFNQSYIRRVIGVLGRLCLFGNTERALQKQPVIHIGFPKCASTFLQREIFPRIPTHYFLNKRYRGESGDYYRSMLLQSFVSQLPDEHPFVSAGKDSYIYSGEQFLTFERDVYLHKVRFPAQVQAREFGLMNLLRFFKDYGRFLVVKGQNKTKEEIPRLSSESMEEIRRVYLKSNEELSALCNLELDRYNYF